MLSPKILQSCQAISMHWIIGDLYCVREKQANKPRNHASPKLLGLCEEKFKLQICCRMQIHYKCAARLITILIQTHGLRTICFTPKQSHWFQIFDFLAQHNSLKITPLVQFTRRKISNKCYIFIGVLLYTFFLSSALYKI